MMSESESDQSSYPFLKKHASIDKIKWNLKSADTNTLDRTRNWPIRWYNSSFEKFKD